VPAAEIKAYRARIPGRKSTTPPVEAGFKSQDFAVEKRRKGCILPSEADFGRIDNVKFRVVHER